MELLLNIPGISGWIIIMFILLVILALPLVVLMDVLRHSFKRLNDKLIWIAIVLFMNVSGSALYFIIGRQQREL